MKAAKEKETGVYYRLMIEHVQKVLGDIKRVVPSYDPAQGYEWAGFVWFQGWNDIVGLRHLPQCGGADGAVLGPRTKSGAGEGKRNQAAREEAGEGGQHEARR